MSSKAQQMVESLLALADIQVNGRRPWDFKVHDSRVFERVLKYRNLGLGESYMEGWWDCDQIDEFIRRIVSSKLDKKVSKLKGYAFAKLSLSARALFSGLTNAQSKTRSLEVGRRHYDIGNDLFSGMLDKNLNYSCGYWKDAQNLDDAQLAKMDLICRKLQLAPGMRLLDIGCGFGTLAQYAAKKYGVVVVGVTISKEQKRLAEKICEGLPIEIRFQDYRDVNERFDLIVSVGMFEHVGSKNYPQFMKVVDRCLSDDGIFLLHTIGGIESSTRTDPWVERYIFPNSMLPSITQIGAAIEPYFVMEDWHNFGLDYAKTLRAWHANFTKIWPTIEGQYSKTFYRMWVYYLLSAAGGFMARSNELWQIVLTKPGRGKAYSAVR